jgi:hypothetical protein
MSEEPNNQLRWAAWAGAVLARVDNPEECRAVILRRQQEVDHDRGEAELVEAEFREMLSRAGHDPDRGCVFIPSGKAADWLRAATKKHRTTSQASAYLQGLGIPALSKTKKDGRPGWRWRGPLAPADATMTRLEK